MPINERTSTQKLVQELYSLKFNEELDIDQILRKLYIDQRMPMKEIAKLLHIGAGTVCNWINDAGLAVRTMRWV
jgi:transposase-like protein